MKISSHSLRQEHLINKQEWDFLIVLDACRYDYFAKMYQEFFLGELKKVISSGIDTLSWLKHTFRKNFLE